MTALIVIGCILLALWLIGQLRVGAAADYSEAGLFLKVKAGPVSIQILPAKKKEEKKPKPAKKHPAEEGAKAAKPKRKLKDTLSLALRFVPLLGEAAGGLVRKIRVDYLLLHVIWGNENPATAAMGYGAGHAAMGIHWPVFEHNFKVKSHDLRIDVDFERKTPAFTARAQVTLTIGQIVSLAARLGVKALVIFLGYRREKNERIKNDQKNEKAVQA